MRAAIMHAHVRLPTDSGAPRYGPTTPHIPSGSNGRRGERAEAESKAEEVPARSRNTPPPRLARRLERSGSTHPDAAAATSSCSRLRRRDYSRRLGPPPERAWPLAAGRRSSPWPCAPAAAAAASPRGGSPRRSPTTTAEPPPPSPSSTSSPRSPTCRPPVSAPPSSRPVN